jgi:hypothetical protein
MKGLKKLVLATAVAAAPFAQAELTAMDDSFLEGMTGQAGITLDLNLDMSIDEIRYADEDGSGEDINDGGYLTMSDIKVFGDQGNGTQALIKGVTIDVDGTEGIVIGLGEIGGASNVSYAPAGSVDVTGLSASLDAAAGAIATDITTLSGAQAAALTGTYWTGVNITTDFGINGTKAGSLAIKNFTNFVPNALAVEGQKKFGYTVGTDIQLTNDNAGGDNLTAIQDAAAGIGAVLVGMGITDPTTATEAQLSVATVSYVADNGNSNTYAEALTAGNFVDASISIKAGGAVDSDSTTSLGAEGLTINAKVGFVIQEMSFTDDGNKMGIHNFTMYDTEADGTIVAFSVEGLTIDVIGASDGFVATNSSATSALQIAGLKTSGSIAMGDIFIGDHTNGSLGAVAIKDIDMTNTSILIYGH